jgi:hypothetical protein
VCWRVVQSYAGIRAAEPCGTNLSYVASDGRAKPIRRAASGTDGTIVKGEVTHSQ